MIDAGIAHPWPREVLEAVARFKQGDLVERPPFFYAATRSYGIWAFTRDSGDPNIEVPLEKSWLVVHDPIEAFHNVVEVTPAPVGWFEDDGFGAVLVHADGSWTSDEE